MPVKEEVAGACTGKWKVEMFQTPVAAPPQFLYGCCCMCCATYTQRIELLNLTGEPYVCCAGLFPCGPLGEPQDRGCLFLEVCCCPGLALSGNRFMVQTRFDKENTPCDDFIITFTFLCVCFLHIADCIGCDIPPEIDFLADCLILTVDGCMYAQQQIEINDVKKQGRYTGPPPAIVAALPPLQRKMIHGLIPKVARTAGPAPTPSPAFTHSSGTARPGNMPSAHVVGAAARVQAQQRPPQQQRMQQPAYAQPVYAQPAPQQVPLQVMCGGCQQVFGSPAAGITVACPHCGTHNAVPVQSGFGGHPGIRPANMAGMASTGMATGQRGARGNGLMVAGAAGAGILGGMAMADVLF